MDSARARILEYYFLGGMSISVAQKIGVPLEALTLPSSPSMESGLGGTEGSKARPKITEGAE